MRWEIKTWLILEDSTIINSFRFSVCVKLSVERVRIFSVLKSVLFCITELQNYSGVYLHKKQVSKVLFHSTIKPQAISEGRGMTGKVRLSKDIVRPFSGCNA